ncbi:HAD family hydrolase [Lentzea californiensis]|uniref:HAD family hydrolase n=1 Tax=Lentzea californiensis TaxID=438851 RepID=UPI002164C064|nr:HAD-IA family hydrolase [Lentzea californiensis]MCR3747240.1 phosphoglycolate phosphatase [Lentzea californiensis]
MNLGANEAIRQIRDFLVAADVLLIDFDGPICSVFSGFPAPIVAEQLREILEPNSRMLLPIEVQRTDDPFEIYKYASRLGEREAKFIESALRAHEVEAIETASPTPGAHKLISTWASQGKKVSIVSNNSAEAVESYIFKHGLEAHIALVSSRSSFDPDELKPNPTLVFNAVEKLGATHSNCIFIGDSSSDMLAGRAAGVRTIGYANKPGKDLTLVQAGAEIVCHSMLDVETAAQLGATE